jgi:UTP--glucose-1-phosphate uridylyltransferase
MSRYGIAASPKRRNLNWQMTKTFCGYRTQRLAIAARYIFRPVIFEALQQTSFGTGNEIQLTDAIRRLIHQGHKVYGVLLQPDEKRYDIGNFESYFRAFLSFALADEKYGENLRAHLKELLDANYS